MSQYWISESQVKEVGKLVFSSPEVRLYAFLDEAGMLSVIDGIPWFIPGTPTDDCCTASVFFQFPVEKARIMLGIFKRMRKGQNAEKLKAMMDKTTVWTLGHEQYSQVWYIDRFTCFFEGFVKSLPKKP